MHCQGINGDPAVLLRDTTAGKVFRVCSGIKDFSAYPAAIGVEVGDVEFQVQFVFHNSSVQPTSDSKGLSAPCVAKPERPFPREHSGPLGFVCGSGQLIRLCGGHFLKFAGAIQLLLHVPQLPPEFAA